MGRLARQGEGDDRRCRVVLEERLSVALSQAWFCTAAAVVFTPKLTRLSMWRAR